MLEKREPSYMVGGNVNWHNHYEEQYEKSESQSRLVVSNSLRSHGLYSPWNSPGQHTGVGSLSLLQDLPSPGIKPRSPALQVDSLPAEPQRKPKNTGVANLSLLQWIFLTQELNWGLLHCRWILYQLSYHWDGIESIDQYVENWHLNHIELSNWTWYIKSFV